MRVHISVTAGPAKGKEFEFDRPANFLFGRDSSAHVSVPNDMFVSRRHFLLTIASAECKLTDLDSKNGVIVNGIRYGGKVAAQPGVTQAPINEVRLQDGDEIRVGTTCLNVSIQSNGHTAHAPSPGNEPDSASLKQRMAVYLQQAQQQRAHLADEGTNTPALSEKFAPSAASKEGAALLLFDIAQSTYHIRNMGDTYFTRMIKSLINRVKHHASSSDLVTMKNTGDGFLAVFNTVSAAFSLASSFLENPAHPDIQFRMALHWGAIKISSTGDLLGMDVHRLTQLEGIQTEAQVEAPKHDIPFPKANRLVITKNGMKRLPKKKRELLVPAGTFLLKNLDETHRLWVMHSMYDVA